MGPGEHRGRNTVQTSRLTRKRLSQYITQNGDDYVLRTVGRRRLLTAGGL
jgi:hypothetical protein